MSVSGSKVLRSALCLVLAIVMALGTCISAFAAEPKESINYVSIGDSMANGYCFDGYEQGNGSAIDFFNGTGVYGIGAYPDQFAGWLKAQGYADEVKHTKLAVSALRAEDLYFLLGGREEPQDGWQDQVNGYTEVDDDVALAEFYQKAVTDADIITLGVGNASFGAYMLHRVTDALGVFGASLDGDEIVDLEDALIDLDDQQKQVVLDAYNYIKAGFAQYIPAELAAQYNVDQICGILAYTAAGFILNYKGSVEQIVKLNPDVEIVLVGLMNTTYGMTVTAEDMGIDPIPVGDIMDGFFAALNAYVAGLPAAMQAAGEWEDAKFYYAGQPNPQFISQQFATLKAAGWENIDGGRLSGSIVRDRNITAYNDSLREMIAAAFSNDEFTLSLPEISLADVEGFEENNPQWNYAGMGYTGYGEDPKNLSVAIYLAIEDAVAASTDTLEIPLEGLMTIASDIGSVFTNLEMDVTKPEVTPAKARETLGSYLTSTDTLKGMCKIYALFKVGNGMSVHPTPSGHDAIAASVQAAYANGHTAKDETIENVKLTLSALYSVLETYGPEVAAQVWAQWEEYGYVDQVNNSIEGLKATLSDRYTYYTETALPAIEAAVGSLAAQKESLCTELTALNTELAAKKAELDAVLAEQEIGDIYIPDININVELGGNEQTEVPEHECVVAGDDVAAELEAAIADLEHAIAVIEALIADITADMEDLLALAEQIAAAVEELEQTLASIVEAADDLAAAIEAAVAVLEDNEGVVNAVIASFDAARATVLAAVDVVELTLGTAETMIADIDAMIGQISTDAEALYNKFITDLPACIAALPEEAQMLIGGAVLLAQQGLEEGKALIEAKLAEDIAALAAEYDAAALEAQLIALAEEYGINEAAIQAEIDAIKAQIEAEVSAQYAAIEAETLAQIAALETEAQAKLEALNAELAGYQAELEAAAEEAKAEIQAQIDRVNGDIATVNEDLACAIEHLENAAQIAYDEIVAEVEAAYEAAMAELETALADLEAAYNAAVAEVEAQLAELKAAYDAAVAELTAAADAAIAELQAAVDAQIAELGKLGEDLAAVVDGIFAELHEDLNAAQTAVAEILAGNLEAAEDLAEALVNMGAESLVDAYEAVKAQVENMFREATTDDYVISSDSYYVAIGDGSAAPESYVEKLAEYFGIEHKNLAQAGLDVNDAFAVISDNAEEVAKADLITIGFSNSAFVSDALNAAANGSDLDWSTYVTDDGVAYVDQALAEISAKLEENGITGELNAMALDAIESYAYSSVVYACGIPEVVNAIRAVNSDAVVIIVGQHNAFTGTVISIEGVEIDLSEYIDYLVTGAAVHGIAYCMLTDNAIYVEAPDAATNTPAEIGMRDLFAIMSGNDSALYPNATGHEYIKNQILKALNISVEEPAGLWGDADSDGDVDNIDSMLVLQYFLGLPTSCEVNTAVCDVDGVNGINNIDAMLILQHFVGIINSFPVEQ